MYILHFVYNIGIVLYLLGNVDRDKQTTTAGYIS